MEAKTDRELIIRVDGRVEALAESVERLATVIERVETVKFTALEERVSRMERIINRWGGAAIAFNLFITLSALLIAFFEYRK